MSFPNNPIPGTIPYVNPFGPDSANVGNSDANPLPQIGAGLAQAYPVTYAGILSHLVGLSAWLQAAAALPEPHKYGEDKIRRSIPAMVRRFERDTNFRVLPVQVSTDPSTEFPGGIQARMLREDPYDYHKTDGYLKIRLRQRPVWTVQSFQLRYGPNKVFSFPADWMQIKQKTGELWIVPASAANVGMTFAAIATGAWGFTPFAQQDYIPNGLHATYTAGLRPLWWIDPYSYQEEGVGRIKIDPGDRRHVIGMGTAFTSAFAPGSYLHVEGLYLGTVACVQSDTSLYLEVGGPVEALGDSVGFEFSVAEVQTAPEWADLQRVLEEYCALAVLNDVAHLADAGLSGVSLSGGMTGQNFQYTRFVDRKEELAKSVEEFKTTLRDQDDPVILGFLGGN